MAFPNIDHLG